MSNFSVRNYVTANSVGIFKFLPGLTADLITSVASPGERGVNIWLFTRMAIGHESIDITYRYAHLFPNKQTEMADKLDMERMGSVTQTDNGTVIQFHMDKEFEPERRKGI